MNIRRIIITVLAVCAALWASPKDLHGGVFAYSN